MITTGWIESVAKKARVKQPCDTHARRNVRRLKMSHARVLSCNGNSWRGCRRVHRGDEAGSEEGGMSSASHLDCQTHSARLGIFQREADATLPAPRAAFLLSSQFGPLLLLHASVLHAFCCHISALGLGGAADVSVRWRACVSVCVRRRSSGSITVHRGGKETRLLSQAKNKDKPFFNSTGGWGRSKERKE